MLGSVDLSVSDPTVDSLLISAPISGVNAAKGVLLEEEVVSRLPRDRDIASTGDEEDQSQAVANFGSQEDLENLRLTEAAIKVQAACRGYQARQTFQTLKVATQLQALIRGHLVRRQAVSALYCVKGIVKFQAMARGYIVRRSDIGLAVQKIRKDTQCSNPVREVTSSQEEKLSESVFVNKLLASTSSAVPLSLNGDNQDPNLAWKWLNHWTRSHFWAPLPEVKKKPDSVSDEKNGSCQTVERGLVKKNTRKSPVMKADDGSISGSNKYKQRPKKDSNRLLLSAQEHPQKEIEKSNSRKTRISDRFEAVNEKRKSSRKISDHTVADVSERGPSDSSEKMKDLAVSKSEESDPEKSLGQQAEDKLDNEPHVNEKRKQSSRKISDHTVADVSEKGPSESSEKMKDLAVSKSKESDPEKSLGQQAEDKLDNEPHDDPIAVLQTSITNGKDEGIQGVCEDLNGGDNCISNNCQRRASLPSNFNDQDNELHSTPRLPSYMAPTESAKAKLRGQGSPRFAADLVDKNSITRRHSLSSSLNGKSGSFSPRAERLVAMSGRGVIKTDRSLSSSRDGTDKLIQPQWRR